MTQRHPRIASALSQLRNRTQQLDRRLEGAEVVVARGVRQTRKARSSGWADSWELVRERCRPCFTLSAGRSGTMLLAKLGALSADLESVHEPLPHLLTESYLAYSGVGEDGFWDEVVGEARDWPVRDALHRGRTWFETNNRLTFLAPSLARHFPSSRFVIIGRDPLAFAESAMARGYYVSHPWDHARIRPRRSDPDHARWDSMSQLERIGWLWRSTYAAAAELSQGLDESRVLRVRAEDLFAGRIDVAETVLRFAGATTMPSEESISARLGVRANAQPTRNRGSMRDGWNKAELALFERQVEPQARVLGYSI